MTSIRLRRPPGRTASAAFTLLEMLVVVLIIGVMATFAVLYMGNRALDEQMSVEARRIDELVGLAGEQAVQQGVELGLLYTRDGYQFLALDPKTGRWQPVESDLLRARKVPEPFQIELRVEGRVVQPAEPVMKAAADSADGKDKKEASAMGRDSGDGADDGPKPHVMLLSSGEATAFALDLHVRGYAPFFRLEGDVLGRLKLTRMDAESRS